MASVVRCIEMGAEDYLQKPYDPVLLNARINACLDKRRLRDQEMEYLRAVTDLTQAAALVEKGQFDERVLATVAARDDALGTLARVFARMAREVQSRVEQLQSDMQKMTKVEIDNREVVREVDRVTTSEAFNKARKHADEVRAKRKQQGSTPAPKPPSVADTVVMPKPPQ
jgi:DNA-binding response OmpR family regulator